MTLPTPHGDKLHALLRNNKLPKGDYKLIEKAVGEYQNWLGRLAHLPEDNTYVSKAVALLNEYRTFLDTEIIFDSGDDFLYRQKGQLKLDNSVIEEFLPHLVTRVFPQIQQGFSVGPRSCFTGLYFTSFFGSVAPNPGDRIRAKDQDFTVSRRLYLKASFDPENTSAMESLETNIGHICAECKTNLDKTMFQEASATAHDIKTAVLGAKYLLLCEWLDMTPISTVGTDIDEVLILRKAKRLSAQMRSAFATKEGRSSKKKEYVDYLRQHPFASDVFERFLSHIRAWLENQNPDEGNVLSRGYF